MTTQDFFYQLSSPVFTTSPHNSQTNLSQLGGSRSNSPNPISNRPTLTHLNTQFLGPSQPQPQTSSSHPSPAPSELSASPFSNSSHLASGIDYSSPSDHSFSASPNKPSNFTSSSLPWSSPPNQFSNFIGSPTSDVTNPLLSTFLAKYDIQSLMGGVSNFNGVGGESSGMMEDLMGVGSNSSNPQIQINPVIDHIKSPKRRQATEEIRGLTTELLKAVSTGNVSSLKSLISEFEDISISEPLERKQKIFGKQIKRLERKDTEEIRATSSNSQPTSATQMFFGGGVTSFAAEPSEMMSTSAPSSIGFPIGQWNVSQLQNQVAGGYGYGGELDERRLSAVNGYPSPYNSALSSIPGSSSSLAPSPIDSYSPGPELHSSKTDFTIYCQPDYKLSQFAYMEDSQQRRLDPKGWRMRSSKSERRIYWFQFTQNEGSWFLEVNLRSRETRKIETEEEFERLRSEEDFKSEEDRECRFIKFNNLPRFWIREKTNGSREILPLNKNDFGEFIKCCSLFYGNCSSNGHCFSFYEISDKSCICDEGQEDKLVRLKKQPFKRPAIIADHVAECLRFRETGFGELCKVKKGWADEDRENGGGGMEEDEDEIDERAKKPLPKRKNNGKPSLAQQPKKFKVESSPNTIA